MRRIHILALTPYGGWHKEDKDLAESWTRKTTHTGDRVGYYEFDHRFEHPGRTWASAAHRAFSFACVGTAMANDTWKFVQAKSKHAMKQVLGIKNETARMKVTPPLAVASLAHGDDLRLNPACERACLPTSTMAPLALRFAGISVNDRQWHRFQPMRAHMPKYTTNM